MPFPGPGVAGRASVRNASFRVSPDGRPSAEARFMRGTCTGPLLGLESADLRGENGRLRRG